MIKESSPSKDLDAVEVDILVIAKNPSSFETAASFLSRRGWPTTVQSNIAQTIDFIAEKKPDLVLISLNHPSPTLLKLPDLISEAFNITCVGFLESLDATSQAKLDQSKLSYKIQGQASGPNLHRAIQEILAEKLHVHLTGEKPKEEVLSMGKYTISKRDRRTFKQITQSESREPLDAEFLTKIKRSLFGDHTRLEKLVETSLARICKPETMHTPVGSPVRLGVFPIDSPITPGYLVVATAMAERPRFSWFKTAEKELTQEFAKGDLPGHFEPGFWITMPETDFITWSSRTAKFTVTLNHEGIEIVAAFFQSDEALPKIGGGRSDGMVSLDVKNVSTKYPVNFKAYLHLNKNRKFYLYLRNGRKLQAEQSKRLEEFNIREFFMKGVDRENVRIFLATVFLTDVMDSNSLKSDQAKKAS